MINNQPVLFKTNQFYWDKALGKPPTLPEFCVDYIDFNIAAKGRDGKSRFQENFFIDLYGSDPYNMIPLYKDKTTGITKRVFVWKFGMRSGKNSMGSALGAYNAIRDVYTRNPQQYFGINANTTIDYITIGIKGDQTKKSMFTLFSEIFKKPKVKEILEFCDPKGTFKSKSGDYGGDIQTEIIKLPKNISIHNLDAKVFSAEGLCIKWFYLDEASRQLWQKMLMHYDLCEQNSSSSFPEFWSGIVAGYPEPSKQDSEDALEIIYQLGLDFPEQWALEKAGYTERDPRIMSIKKATFEVNPKREESDFAIQMKLKPVLTSCRIYCERLPDKEQMFFWNTNAIDKACRFDLPIAIHPSVENRPNINPITGAIEKDYRGIVLSDFVGKIEYPHVGAVDAAIDIDGYANGTGYRNRMKCYIDFLSLLYPDKERNIAIDLLKMSEIWTGTKDKTDSEIMQKGLIDLFHINQMQMDKFETGVLKQNIEKSKGIKVTTTAFRDTDQVKMYNTMRILLHSYNLIIHLGNADKLKDIRDYFKSVKLVGGKIEVKLGKHILDVIAHICWMLFGELEESDIKTELPKEDLEKMARFGILG